ncbi:MAG: hypothetical protein M9941_17010 [Anaerolineae bacterium]|nr:hypothetical protein [Anaerolineae bacterium]MCO5192050.1 hypothetical protein [Anaerolineae bacterium]MCO5199445.1 hypothetical protein [Anaerolineae bacterium]
MSLQTITINLPQSLFQSAEKIAQITQRPLDEVVRDSLTHTLPPLDDVAAEDMEMLARLSTLDDTALWRKAEQQLTSAEQDEMQQLLERQSSDSLQQEESERLAALMDEYGRLLVQKAHAWLLLARRGYKTPLQQTE